MADKLTPQQEQAVNNRGGNLLVSAAAGSGKTKVLVDRLLRYLTDSDAPANLDEFLIITYTKAAASELRGKIASKLAERIAEDPENRHLQKQMQRLFLTKISTVHGFCSDILREYAYRLDISSDFRVADENECQEIRVQVLKELLDSMYESAEDMPEFRAFVDTQGLGRDDRLVPEIILKVYDSARCHQDPNGWLEKSRDAFDIPETSDIAGTAWGQYLMADLHRYLDAQISVFKGCIQDAESSGGMEKAALNLRETLLQLEAIRNAENWDDIFKNKTVDYGRLTFPRKNYDIELADRMKAARNACKKNLEKKLHAFSDPSGQILQDLQQSAAGARGLISLAKRFDAAYQQAKQSRRVLDFSDLEHKMLDLLLGKRRTGITAAAHEIGRRFREIMVDEYQDSNQVQDAIFSALTAERQNCFMVGDVKQSIYQFRLADPSIFLEKYNTYAPAELAEKGEGRKIFLSHNFRSGAEVIDAVNDVFSACMSPEAGGMHYGEAEALREGVPHEVLPDPAVELDVLDVQEDTYQEEAAFVADKIHTMIKTGVLIRSGDAMRPVTADDIVILLRSPGSVGKHYQRALEAKGIPCISGGGADLLKTEEIAAFRSLLQIIVNPRQDIPLIGILASPVFGFTANDLACIRSRQKHGSIYDALLASDLPKAQSFVEILKKLRYNAKMMPLTGLLESCFALTHFDSIYAAMPGGEARKANLQTFFQLAVDYENNSLRDLAQFLEHLDALEGRGIIGAGSAAAGAVTIMSIHKSKGLEFPVVFLCGLSRGFNRESLQAQVLCDKELGLGLSVADTQNRIRYPSIAKRAISLKMASESLSEEMRVLYVAMTRARDRLVMLYSAKKPEADLADIALRLDFDGGKLLCADAVSPGEWILLSAMQHMEAGELHSIGGRPATLKLQEHPWKIQLVHAPEPENAAEMFTDYAESVSTETEAMLQKALQYEYPHLSATQAPSKQTATGRKNRAKDAEAAEGTQEPKFVHREWRSASFGIKKTAGKEYGNAIHGAMQFVRYDACGDAEQVQQELYRLVKQGFLRQEQADMVAVDKIAAFFSTEIGCMLRQGVPHVREFKFSILDDAQKYGDGLEGEQILLQGVVDCALLEADGITVLDFKTDYVTEETVAAVAGRYRPQLETYAEAMERIYRSPIKKRLIYFFRLNRFVEV